MTEAEEKKRTRLQNKSLHLYCELLATALNDAGYDMKAVLFGPIEGKIMALVCELCPEHTEAFDSVFLKYHMKVDVPWTKDSTKACLWKPIQRVMMNKESTTELDTKGPSAVYDVLCRHISENYGVFVEWPSMDSLMRSGK